jgi:hypothetical protein
VLSEATVEGLTEAPPLEKLPPQTVKGRESEVTAYRLAPEGESESRDAGGPKGETDE